MTTALLYIIHMALHHTNYHFSTIFSLACCRTVTPTQAKCDQNISVSAYKENCSRICSGDCFRKVFVFMEQLSPKGTSRGMGACRTNNDNH